MEIIADLQIHSKYVRAVSKYMELQYMTEWGRRKGIDLLGTGDWQHPEWFESIKENLVEIQNGIFELKELAGSQHSVSYMLQSEISCIYSQGGKGRRIHNLIFSPSIETCEKVIQELKKRGANLESDGRPIIGISSKDLLDLLLTIDENILFIPAHVWTPWFGMYGSKSGFDSIEECFGDLSKYIYAIETGLSSDPAMNWGIKELENRSIVSFSDAHSAQKMGREATVFRVKSEEPKDSKWSYFDIVNAIKQNGKGNLEISYTIEFFPEEGKYHLSGHRAHSVIYTEKDLKEKGFMCPVCNRKLTIGVEHRIRDLSEKPVETCHGMFPQLYNGVSQPIIQNQKNELTFISDKEKKRKPFISTVPLLEILIEVHSSKAKANREYERITNTFPEFEILLKLSYEELEKLGGEKFAEATRIVRERKVHIEPGYDGVFGKVRIFKD